MDFLYTGATSLLFWVIYFVAHWLSSIPKEIPNKISIGKFGFQHCFSAFIGTYNRFATALLGFLPIAIMYMSRVFFGNLKKSMTETFGIIRELFKIVLLAQC